MFPACSVPPYGGVERSDSYPGSHPAKVPPYGGVESMRMRRKFVYCLVPPHGGVESIKKEGAIVAPPPRFPHMGE